MERVARRDAPRLRVLLSDYLSEFARSQGIDPERESDGRPSYPWFDAYWEEEGRIPLGFLSGTALVGFCLLRDDGHAWQVAEFYVAPAHRRQGIGSIGVERVRALCRRLGRHRHLRADVRRWNEDAYRFWAQHGFEPVEENQDRTVMTMPL